MRLPKIFNLRRDPFERADENANIYWDWVLDHIFVMYPMQALAAEQIQSFAEFPTAPENRRPFNLDSVLEAMGRRFWRRIALARLTLRNRGGWSSALPFSTDGSRDARATHRGCAEGSMSGSMRAETGERSGNGGKAKRSTVSIELSTSAPRWGFAVSYLVIGRAR